MTLLQGASSLQTEAERWVLTKPLISVCFYEGSHLLGHPGVTANVLRRASIKLKVRVKYEAANVSLVVDAKQRPPPSGLIPIDGLFLLAWCHMLKKAAFIYLLSVFVFQKEKCGITKLNDSADGCSVGISTCSILNYRDVIFNRRRSGNDGAESWCVGWHDNTPSGSQRGAEQRV